MPILLAQSGLFIVSAVFMYVMFGLPIIILIAALMAVAGGGSGNKGRRFVEVFCGLALASGAAVLAACVWAYLHIGAR